jgi:predicted ATPase
VPAEIAAALGVQQVAGKTPQEMVVAAVTAQRLLIVLDNCERLLTAVAELCGDLLKSADDVRILATSREQLWVSGETRYRLSPLQLVADFIRIAGDVAHQTYVRSGTAVLHMVTSVPQASQIGLAEICRDRRLDLALDGHVRGIDER